jgi:uncharacterized membrane protein
MPRRFDSPSNGAHIILSAAFAALTAIFAKIGVANVNADLQH